MIKRTFFGLCFMLLVSKVFSQDPYLDSLKKTLGTGLNDTTRMQVLQVLVESTGPGEWEVYNKQLMDFTEKKLRDKQISSAVTKKTREYLAGTYHNTGISYLEKADQENALVWFTKALEFSQKHNITDMAASANYGIGNLYYRKGDFKKAVPYMYKALKLNETTGNQLGVADALMSIGNVYHQLNNRVKALEYYQQGLKIQETIHDSMGMGQNLAYMAIVYQEDNDFTNAIAQYKRALAISQAIGDPRQMASIISSLGRLMQRMRKFDSSLYYYQLGLQQWERLGDKEGLGQSLYNMANIYYAKKQYDRAFALSDRALEVANDLGYASLTAKIYFVRYRILKAQNKHAQALQTYEEYVSRIDSIENDNTRKAIVEQKLQYEFEKKEILSKAKTEKRLNQIKIENERKTARQNLWIIVLIASLCLVVVSGYFLYKHLRQRTIIANQKSHILKQRLLVSQMNPHFVFNSLNAIQNYIFKQDSMQAGMYLAKFADLMRMILEFSRRDYITVDEETKMLTNYLDLQQLRFEKKFTYAIEVDEVIDPENVLIPPMLAQPFIENAIEHGIFHKETPGHVNIKIKFDEKDLVYEIEDDGVGLEKSAVMGQRPGKKHTSLATIIAKERMEAYSDQDGKNMYIAIADKVKTDPAASGVKVSFSVPYQEIL